jgi:hypothetical protein
VRSRRVRVRAMVIASGRSCLTTRPTVFMDRFATAIRHLSCAETGGNAKTINAHWYSHRSILYAVPAAAGFSLPYTIATELM